MFRLDLELIVKFYIINKQERIYVCKLQMIVMAYSHFRKYLIFMTS